MKVIDPDIGDEVRTHHVRPITYRMSTEVRHQVLSIVHNIVERAVNDNCCFPIDILQGYWEGNDESDWHQ
jgi:hypothetical protein